MWIHFNEVRRENMILLILLKVGRGTDNRNTGPGGEKNSMHGKRSGTAKKEWTKFRLGDGPVDPGHHHTALLKMPDPLPECAKRGRKKFHSDSPAHFIFHLTPPLWIWNRERQWLHPLPAEPLKDEIKVAEM